MVLNPHKVNRNVNKIVIHCSDSEFGCSGLIRDWHTKGNGWSDIGYHFVIPNGRVFNNQYNSAMDGSLEVGRPLEVPGAHARGHNQDTVAICLIGVKDFTTKQLHTLSWNIMDLIKRFDLGIEDVIGHNELDNSKTCPNIDMDELRNFLKITI